MRTFLDLQRMGFDSDEPNRQVDVRVSVPYNIGKDMTTLQHELWMEELGWNANIRPRLPARG